MEITLNMDHEELFKHILKAVQEAMQSVVDGTNVLNTDHGIAYHCYMHIVEKVEGK